MNNAIEIKNLIKQYGTSFKLGELNLNIPSGFIIGLIGENGAGKTTLLKSILNILQINQGSIKIFDKDYKNEESLIKEDIGVVLDNSFFPEILLVKDIDSIMKNIYKQWDSEMFNNYLNNFAIDKNKQIKALSKGMRKKLEIAAALSHHPKLLILDEPTSGLDPVVRQDILNVFQKFVSDDEHTILLSTHITSDLEHIADKIVFIDKGQILLEDTRDNIMDNFGIIKCDEKAFKKIDSTDIIKFIKNKYDYEVLIKNKTKLVKKYPDYIIDKITLENLMILMIKGENI